MDIFGPTRMQSLGGKRYYLVVVDDYTSYRWVFFLTHKHEAFSHFSKLIKNIQNEKKKKVFSLASRLIVGRVRKSEFLKFL